MLQEKKLWRTTQIAAVLLYRYFDDIEISYSNNSIYDLIVTFSDGIKFGVLVRNSTYTKSQDYENIIQQLKLLDYSNRKNRIPIILLCVNESLETTTFAFLVGWKYGRVDIYKNMELRTLTKDNANRCKTLIKSMSDVISIISNDEWGVLKKIDIEKKIQSNELQYAEVIYLRKFTETYKMHSPKVIDEKEKFNQLYLGISEFDYPNDDLDNIILSSIQQQFSNAKLHSSLFISSTDVASLRIYKNRYCGKSSLIIYPNLSAFLSCYESSINLKPISLEIYVENPNNKSIFEGLSFDYEMPFDKWLNDIPNLNRQINTIQLISTYY